MRYRDSKTGRLVKTATAKRAIARGSKRYKQVRRRRTRKKHPRYANVLIETGYDASTPGNGYRFTILIQRKKGEDTDALQDRIVVLIGKGYFDQFAPDFDETEFTWATFHNYRDVIGVTAGRKRFPAELHNFERE